MKAKELSRKSPNHVSFSTSKHKLQKFLSVWHYHEELELVYIRKSKGTRFIGDSIGKFQVGDLVLIGPKLPHLWLTDTSDQEGNNYSEAWVIHFHPDCLGKEFFSLPELKQISNLIAQSKVGLTIEGKNKPAIIEILSVFFEKDGPKKVIDFLTILTLIAEESEKFPLASDSFVEVRDEAGNSKLDVVCNYVFNNFKREIKLEDLAEIAHMNPSSFSRYFKRVTNKTFVQFLNEVRVGYVCKRILEEDDLNIAQIAFESGYNNLSNFNKQFRNYVNMTPKEYHKRHVFC